MLLRKTQWTIVGIGLASLVLLTVCFQQGYWFFGSALGTVGLCSFALLASPLPAVRRMLALPPIEADEDLEADEEPYCFRITDVNDTEQLVEQMLFQGRFALLLRRQIAQQLSPIQQRRAFEALEARSGIVPPGPVLLERWSQADLKSLLSSGAKLADAGVRVVQVGAFFLDRHQVTNRQYYQFVLEGGYEQLSLWEPAIVPAIMNFVDRTGRSGPRFWTDGRFSTGEEDFPVVGVSWYEAAAYARWLGMRLPSNAEWTKAAAWPVAIDGVPTSQRQFPWGDAMDRQLANLWGSGPGQTCSVYDYEGGASVGGVYQLIGNVWEWTSSPFSPRDMSGMKLELPTAMKSIRGGAFDTYFDSQANCQFQSGDNPLSRKHNIGFRCALSFCDLATDLTEAPELAGTGVEA